MRLSELDGLVAVGGDLEPETLLAAYRRGIFPWPVEGTPLLWFSPERRAVLDFESLHISRSLKRSLSKISFHCTVDRAFEGVIRACADTREETWILPEMIEAYCRLHTMGFAHSVETWLDDHLVGGIYGVEVDGVFSAESMFHLETDASKWALVHLVEWLKERGLTWMDVQVMNPHLARLGATEITKSAFLKRLKRDQKAR